MERVGRLLKTRRRDQTAVDAATVRRAIADLDRKLSTAASRLLDVESSLVASVRAAMLELQNRRSALERQLSATPPKPEQSPQAIAERLWALAAETMAKDPERARRALEHFFARIDVEYTERQHGNSVRWRPSGVVFSFLPTEGISSALTTAHGILPRMPLRRELVGT